MSSVSYYKQAGDVFYREGQEFQILERINYNMESFVRVRSASGEEIFLQEEKVDDQLRYVYATNVFLNRRLSYKANELENGDIIRETCKFLVIDNIKIDDKEYILTVEYGVAQDAIRIGEGVSHVPVHIFSNSQSPREYMVRGPKYKWVLLKYSMKMKTTIYQTIVSAYQKSQK